MIPQEGMPPMRDLKAYMKPSDINRLLAEADKSTGYKRDRDMLLLRWLAYSGRRVGEVLRVKVMDIDFEEASCMYNILKKKKPLKKIKPMNYDLLSLAQEYVIRYDLKPEEYIFKSSINIDKPISDARVRQIVYKYVERANLPDFAPGKHIHPHTFRHSFAVANAKKMQSPSDIVKLKNALEHSDVKVTMHYLQFSDKDQRNTVEDLY